MAMVGQEGGGGVLAWLAFTWRGEEWSVELGRRLVTGAVREWIRARVGGNWSGLAWRHAGYRRCHGRARWWGPAAVAVMACGTCAERVGEREGSGVVEVRG
jgi:hypothetical protein